MSRRFGGQGEAVGGRAARRGVIRRAMLDASGVPSFPVWMVEADPSVLDVLESSMEAPPTFGITYFLPCGRVKDRVLKHDLLHVLLIDRA